MKRAAPEGYFFQGWAPDLSRRELASGGFPVPSRTLTLSSAIVLGGYGTFGSIIASELADAGIRVVIAGRDYVRAKEAAQRLGPSHEARRVDVRKRVSCLAALRSNRVAVNCTGPFSTMDATVINACLETGCHYVDIAESFAYVSMLRGYGKHLAEAGLSAVYGCSCLPGISGALAILLRESGTSDPELARVTLFIGSANPTGLNSIRAAVRQIGKPLEVGDVTITGFQEPEMVAFPAPFGNRRVLSFASPEYGLFPAQIGAKKVTVKVGFESRLGMLAFDLLGRLPFRYGRKTANLLKALCRPTGQFGHSGGVVRTELIYGDGASGKAMLYSKVNGQRMAALPCIIATKALMDDSQRPRGAIAPYELLGARTLIDGLMAGGFRLETEMRPA